MNLVDDIQPTLLLLLSLSLLPSCILFTLHYLEFSKTLNLVSPVGKQSEFVCLELLLWVHSVKNYL